MRNPLTISEVARLLRRFEEEETAGDIDWRTIKCRAEDTLWTMLTKQAPHDPRADAGARTVKDQGFQEFGRWCLRKYGKMPCAKLAEDLIECLAIRHDRSVEQIGQLLPQAACVLFDSGEELPSPDGPCTSVSSPESPTMSMPDPHLRTSSEIRSSIGKFAQYLHDYYRLIQQLPQCPGATTSETEKRTARLAIDILELGTTIEPYLVALNINDWNEYQVDVWYLPVLSVIESQINRWSWGFILQPDGKEQIDAKYENHKEKYYVNLLQFGRGWMTAYRVDPNSVPTPHPGARHSAKLAEDEKLKASLLSVGEVVRSLEVGTAFEAFAILQQAALYSPCLGPDRAWVEESEKMALAKAVDALCRLSILEVQEGDARQNQDEPDADGPPAELMKEVQETLENHGRIMRGIAHRNQLIRQDDQRMPDTTNIGGLRTCLDQVEELKTQVTAAPLGSSDAHFLLMRRWQKIEATPGYRELLLYINAEFGMEVGTEAIKQVEARLAKLRQTTLVEVRFLSLVEAAHILRDETPAPADAPDPAKTRHPHSVVSSQADYGRAKGALAATDGSNYAGLLKLDEDKGIIANLEKLPSGKWRYTLVGVTDDEHSEFVAKIAALEAEHKANQRRANKANAEARKNRTKNNEP
jgi:hypothetical protein